MICYNLYTDLFCLSLISVVLCHCGCVVDVFSFLNEILCFDIAICDTHNYSNIAQSCLDNQVFSWYINCNSQSGSAQNVSNVNFETSLDLLLLNGINLAMVYLAYVCHVSKEHALSVIMETSLHIWLKRTSSSSLNLTFVVCL